MKFISTSAELAKPCCQPYRLDKNLWRCHVEGSDIPADCNHRLTYGGLDFCLQQSAKSHGKGLFNG